jgi:hypothetical protein
MAAILYWWWLQWPFIQVFYPSHLHDSHPPDQRTDDPWLLIPEQQIPSSLQQSSSAAISLRSNFPNTTDVDRRTAGIPSNQRCSASLHFRTG